MEYRYLIGNPKYRALRRKSYRNELGRLAQGIPGRVKGTDNVFFIGKVDIPADQWKDVTYGRIIVSYRPKKLDPNHTRLTISSNRVK